jgi:hypothetical protein
MDVKYKYNIKDYLDKFLTVISKWQTIENVMVEPGDTTTINGRVYTALPIYAQYFINRAYLEYWGSVDDWRSSENTLVYLKYRCGDEDCFELSQEDLNNFLNAEDLNKLTLEYYFDNKFDNKEADERLKKILEDFDKKNKEAREEAIKKYHSNKENLKCSGI